MITPPALPGHPFGKVGARGFPDGKGVDTIGIPDSRGPARRYGPDLPENRQVRAVRGKGVPEGARGG